MLRSFIINSIRHIWKHRGNLVLNVTGLTIGLTSFFLISLYVFHELSYDRFHKNYRNIYRIKIAAQLEGSAMDQALTAGPMSRTLLADYPEVEQSVRIHRSGSFLVQYGETRFNEDGVLFADSSFFNVFDFKLLRGDPKTVLVNPRSMVLTEDYARKYFGNEDPIGKSLRVESDSILCTVTGIVQNIPSNSHLKFDILCSLSSLRYYYSNNEWLSHNVYTYIVLKDGTRKQDFEARLPEIVVKYAGPKIKEVIGVTLEDFQRAGNKFEYKLEPLKDIHMRGATQQRLEPPGSLMNVYVFSLIAFLILVIAIINYINLATAQSAGRAKEVGIRKVSGSGRSELILHFITESLIIASIATIIAFMLLLVLLPLFNHLIGKEISLALFSGYKGFILLLTIILFTGVSAGSYPAFVLASFSPSEVLKGTMNPGSVSKTLRGILVVFQFTVSIVIIIGAIVIYSQLKFMTSYDTGINKENLIIIRRPDALGRYFYSFRQQILKLPGVENAAVSTALPGKRFNYTAVILDDDPAKTTNMVNEAVVSYGFPQVMGIKLVEGRFFSEDYGNDTMSVVVNEAAVKLLRLKDPLGKCILHPTGGGRTDRLRIVGIMKDFNIESLHTAISPVCLTFMRGSDDGYICVRLNGRNVRETIGSIEKIWGNYSGRQPFQYSFFADELDRLYETEFKAGRIFIMFALLATFIACLGLIGLITYMTTIRTREIGIRKTFGATGGSIVTLFSREVVSLIIISSLLAYPVAWFGIRVWMESFAERIRVSPVIYIFASVLALSIGWAAISYRAIRAAGYNPAKALSFR
jgi:putative ABC transport system permease protein